MQAICTGAISFGLVTIPVKVYSATRDMRPQFRTVHASCGSPLELSRRCPTCQREIPAGEVGRAHGAAPGESVPFTKEELAAAQGEDRVGAIHLVEVVTPDEIDIAYVDKSYWVVPAGPSTHGYALLRECLAETKRVALAHVKLRTRPRVAMLRPCAPFLSMAMLRFADEVVTPGGLLAPKGETFSDSERQLARDLLAKLASPFDLSKHPDRYRLNVDAMVDRKLAAGAQRSGGGQASDRTSAGASSVLASVTDLTDLLAQSIRDSATSPVAGPRLAKARRKKGADSKKHAKA